LAIDGQVEVRLRVTSASSVLTLKAGSGLARTEIEVPITAADGEALWPHTQGRQLDKVRHRIALPAGEVADLDLYEGRLAGLATVEVEFVDEAAARSFTPPSWFGRELTGKPGWSNASLAARGRPS
jgi:CYTH domain-containing protein